MEIKVYNTDCIKLFDLGLVSKGDIVVESKTGKSIVYVFDGESLIEYDTKDDETFCVYFKNKIDSMYLYNKEFSSIIELRKFMLNNYNLFDDNKGYITIDLNTFLELLY